VPDFGAATKSLVETDGHFGGNAGVAVDQVGELAAAYAQHLCGLGPVRPRGSRQSCLTDRPGWGGFFISICST